MEKCLLTFNPCQGGHGMATYYTTHQQSCPPFHNELEVQDNCHPLQRQHLQNQQQ